MGMIKINNIIYGSNNSADILYKNITVEEKLDTIPIFDINDNGAVVVESDVLTYGHIVDNLNSTESNKILSAKQGKILSEKIDNIDLSYLEEDILAVENKIDNFQVAKTMTQAAYDALPEEEKKNGIYVIEDEGNVFTAKNIEYDGSISGLGATVQQAIDNTFVNINNINKKLPFQLGVDANGNYGYVKDGADTVTPFSKYPELITSAYTTAASYTYTFTKDYSKVYIIMYEGDSDNNNDNTCSTSSSGWKNLGAKITLAKSTYLTYVKKLEQYYNIDIHTNVDTYMYGFIFTKDNVKSGESIAFTTSHGRKNHYLFFDAGTGKGLSLLDLIF